ncbi:hypothetical protein [Alteromonas phage ZP6]|uniref:Uncharacterized protein n=1 Tax=Alteromonas phage ZP6 TaxID=2492447 RepID=A0A3S9U8A7_9CAUD|nr:hypothetical protein PQC03_gp07 [Alteromonas phage ZP6]AZS06557.1 hypothetical protein [Alteromonas phage ZP6]
MKINRQRLAATFRNAEAGGEGAGGGQPEGGANENGALDNGNSDTGGIDAGGDWLASVPQEHRAQFEKNGIKDVAGLAKQFVDLQSHLGNSIRIPSAEAGDEDKNAFYEKIRKHAPDLMPVPTDDESKAAIWQTLGTPAEATEYSVEVPEPLNGTVGDDRINMFREVAHKHKLTKDQFQGVVSEILGADAQAYQDAVAQQKAGHDSLRSKWGEAYEQRIGHVNSLLEQTGAPESLAKAVAEGNVDAAAVEWIFGLTDRMGQDEGTNLARDQGNGKLTPHEAEAQMSEILNNKQHPYWDSGHPDHKRAVDTMMRLGRAARPETANRKIGANAFDLKT